MSECGGIKGGCAVCVASAKAKVQYIAEKPYDQFEVVERHPNSARFHEVLGELGELHDKKQQDYGRGDDPFANVRAAEYWGQPSWVGAMIRVDDKVRRLQSLIRNGKLENEAAEDSFRDIAVYAVIALCLYEEDQRGKD